MELMEAIKTRRSIRKYKSETISQRTILRILEAANLAPTAGNTQPWEFLVLHRSVLDQLSGIIEMAMEDRIKTLTEDGMRERLRELPIPTDESGDKVKGLKKFCRLLGQAPVALIVYADKPEDPWAYKNIVEDVSAAFENLVLAAWDEGLGTCWMTGPLQKGEEGIKKLLGLSKTQEIIAMTPLGIPAQIPSMPPKKDIRSKIRWLGFKD
jgi:nitroreductase